MRKKIAFLMALVMLLALMAGVQPAAFADDKIDNLVALIKVYFKRGGQEVQINATSREILEDAMKHPENYGDLVVRVSGFSAYYVGLGRDVQLDILNRTSQG